MRRFDTLVDGLSPRSVTRLLQPAWWVGVTRRSTGVVGSTLRHGLSRPLDVVVPALLEEVLRHARLTDLVLSNVDLDRVAAAIDLDAAAARIDIEAIVARIDLIGLAEEIIDGVDLPEIIRESTGSMASETVRSVRMQGIVADEAVGRAVDRLLARRSRHVPPGISAGDEHVATEPPGPA
jgi:hypothetical protein